MSIPDEYLINDIRDEKHFSDTTFSGYLKNDVYKALFNAITEFKIEESCNWCIELILSCQTSKLYEKYIVFACKCININNFKMPSKIYKRYKMYVDSKITNIEARNSQVVRNHLIELTVILCLSHKSKSLVFSKMTEDDFKNELLVKKLKANNELLTNYIKYNDPPELKIILNEFWYNITQKNLKLALYWLNWIITYEKKLNKQKKDLICADRKIQNVPSKFHSNFIWLLWTIILKESYKLNSSIFNEIQSLFNIYILDYKKSKSIFIIINALQYFTDIYDNNMPVCNNFNVIIQAVSKVNILFQRKKQNEIKHKVSVSTNVKTPKDKKNEIFNKKLELISDIDNFILNK